MEVVLALGGLFATGIQVSEMLNRFVSAVINAPNNIRYLKSEVENFTGIVSVLQAKTTAQAPPNPLKVTPGNYFSAALDSARQKLSDLYRELDRVASHGSRLWEGIKYAYKEQTFSTLLLQLMNHKATLQLLVSLTSTESSEERCMIMRRFTRDSAVTDCESYVAAPTNVSSLTLTNAGGNPHATRSSAFAHETSTRSVSGKPAPNHNPTASAPVIVTASPNVVPSVAIYPMPAPPAFTAPKYSLHEAVGKRDKRMVYYFLQLGHDVNQDHPELETPLAYAVWLGEAQIVTYLLLFGANVNVKNRLGRSLLHGAVVTGDEVILHDLLKRQTPVNEADMFGDTALHIATYFARTKMVDLLIQWGADVERKNGRGLAPGISPWRVLKLRRRVTVCGLIWGDRLGGSIPC